MEKQKNLLLLIAALVLVGMIGFSFWPTISSQTSQSVSGPSTTSPSNPQLGESSANLRNPVQPTPTSSARGASLVKTAAIPVVWKNLPTSTKVVEYHPVAVSSDNETQALVQVGGQAYELSPNQMGSFNQILVAPETLMHVSVAYPHASPGDVINLEIEDGGAINGNSKSYASLQTLGADGQIHFDFQVNQEEGIYRVALRNGSETQMLNFWVNSKS